MRALPDSLVLHAFSESPEAIAAVLRVARNAARSLPAAIEVVIQGGAVTGVAVDGGFADDLAQTMDQGVRILACGNSMTRAEVDPLRLVSGIEVVPSAVVHITERQWAGAAYVRI